MKTIPVLALGLLGLLAPAPQNTEAAPLPFHFQLEKSAPAADSTVPAPSEIRLWFTQVPQENTTSIHLLDPAGDPVHTGEVVQDPENGMVFSVEIHGKLNPGTYGVVWRALGDDGHVVRGEYAFSVSAD